MHPVVNTFGAGPEAPGAEEIWDEVLSRGFVIWGVASDDEHELTELLRGDPADPAHGALPGRGWITVRSQHLTTAEIMSAIEKGDFYASTGVELDDYQANQKQLRIKIEEDKRFQTKYRTQFTQIARPPVPSVRARVLTFFGTPGKFGLFPVDTMIAGAATFASDLHCSGASRACDGGVSNDPAIRSHHAGCVAGPEWTER